MSETDPELQKELNDLLQEQEKRLGERNARDQAVAANTILALMAFAHGGLNEEERVKAVVRALGMAFNIDPEPLLMTMLGLCAGAAAAT